MLGGAREGVGARGINCTAVPLRATNQCERGGNRARGRGKARARGAAGARARPGREERDKDTSEDVSARRCSAFAPRVGSRARGYGRSLAPAGDIVVESRTHRGEDGGGSEAGEGGLAELLDLLDDGGLGGGGLDGLTVTSGGGGKGRRQLALRIPDAGEGRGCCASVASRHDERQTDLARRRARASASRATSRSKDERRFGVRVASFSRAFHVASRVARQPEPRANPVGAIKTPHRSSERIAKTKIPRWGLPPVTHRLLVRTAEARATTVVAEMQAIFLVGVEEGGEMCVQI